MLFQPHKNKLLLRVTNMKTLRNFEITNKNHLIKISTRRLASF